MYDLRQKKLEIKIKSWLKAELVRMSLDFYWQLNCDFRSRPGVNRGGIDLYSSADRD